MNLINSRYVEVRCSHGFLVGAGLCPECNKSPPPRVTYRTARIAALEDLALASIRRGNTAFIDLMADTRISRGSLAAAIERLLRRGAIETTGFGRGSRASYRIVEVAS